LYCQNKETVFYTRTNKDSFWFWSLWFRNEPRRQPSLNRDTSRISGITLLLIIFYILLSMIEVKNSILIFVNVFVLSTFSY